MNQSPFVFSAIALPGIPLIQEGDALVPIMLDTLAENDIELQDNDVLVISSKILSKVEGKVVDLRDVVPSAEACDIAQETQKDPRIVELVLRESTKISRLAKHVLVTEHRLGFVSANAGIDQSNVNDLGEQVLLLPDNPDESAQRIHDELFEKTGAKAGIVISDTHGRPFRLGNVGVAIGVAGMPALVDLRGQKDLFGRELEASIVGYADLVASAAHLLSGEAAEGRPIVLMRGLEFASRGGRASELSRPPEQDLYR